MNRRTVLAGAPSGFLVPLAGCLSDRDEFLGQMAPFGSDSPVDPPEERPEWEKFRWYDDPIRVHDYDEDDAQAFIEPSRRTMTMEAGIEFGLTNESDPPVHFSGVRWAVLKWEDGRWYPVPQFGGLHDCMRADPGERYIFDVEPIPHERVIDGEPFWLLEGDREWSGDPPHITQANVPGMTSGTYAFGLPTRRGECGTDVVDLLQVYFEVDVPSFQLNPTSHITALDWEGDTLVGTAVRDWNRSPGRPLRDAIYELTEIEDADDPTPVIKPQLVQGQLGQHGRDAFALYREYEPEVVRIEDKSDRDAPFRIEGPQEYAYEGSYYRVTAAFVD